MVTDLGDPNLDFLRAPVEPQYNFSKPNISKRMKIYN